MILCISAVSVVTSPFSSLILLIWVFSLFFLMSLANGFSILFIFSKNQLLVLLIFAIGSFVSFSFISHLIFMIKDLLVRPDTIKLLKENIGRTLYDINHSKILFDPPPREMEIKTKINKWDLLKLKSFCKAKETTNKTKRQLDRKSTRLNSSH